jgi:hypothetical protein
VQHTTLSGSGATCGTGYGQHLFRREFALLHSANMLSDLIARRLHNIVQRVMTTGSQIRAPSSVGAGSVIHVAIRGNRLMMQLNVIQRRS